MERHFHIYENAEVFSNLAALHEFQENFYSYQWVVLHQQRQLKIMQVKKEHTQKLKKITLLGVRPT